MTSPELRRAWIRMRNREGFGNVGIRKGNGVAVIKLPWDDEAVLKLNWHGDAQGPVRAWMADAIDATAERCIYIYDSALQTNPAPHRTQFLTGIHVRVPLPRPGSSALRLYFESGPGDLLACIHTPEYEQALAEEVDRVFKERLR